MSANVRLLMTQGRSSDISDGNSTRLPPQLASNVMSKSNVPPAPGVHSPKGIAESLAREPLEVTCVVEARSEAAKSGTTPASVVSVILPLGAERSRSSPNAAICGGESCAAVLWRAAQLSNRTVMMHFVMVAFDAVGAVVDWVFCKCKNDHNFREPKK